MFSDGFGLDGFWSQDPSLKIVVPSEDVQDKKAASASESLEGEIKFEEVPSSTDKSGVE